MSPRQTSIRHRGQTGWYRVDNEVLTTYAPLLKTTGIAVYNVLCMHADWDSQQCWPSHPTIAREAGCSVSTVKRALRVLVREGLILKETLSRKGGGVHNRYTLLSLKEKEDIDRIAGTHLAGGTSTEAPGGVAKHPAAARGVTDAPAPEGAGSAQDEGGVTDPAVAEDGGSVQEEDGVAQHPARGGVREDPQVGSTGSERLGEGVRVDPEQDPKNNKEVVWKKALQELSWQMSRPAFDRWLRGSSLAQLGERAATVHVRDTYAVDWCANRMIVPIRRTLTGLLGRKVEVTFCAAPQAA